ncbi:MAG: hypothetical protein GFGODING_02597 [Flavobacteriales bacterium]|nr:hypothetical protein [Flavobacteriales bacterium]
MIEASRFCMAPEHRGLRTAWEFALAMTETLFSLGVEHGLFGCFTAHAAFYKLLEFRPLNSAGDLHYPGAACSCMTYAYKEVLAATNRLGTTRGIRQRN